MAETTPKQFRISVEGIRLLALLQAKYGVSATAVIEIALRTLAGKEGVGDA